MTKDNMDSAFYLFGGLFAYYSLQRLHPMRLFDFDKLNFSNIRVFSRKLLLGFTANILVALSFIISWKWYGYMLPTFENQQLEGFGHQFAGMSIIISSTSMVLITHRVIAFLAIKFKKVLFECDEDFMTHTTNDFKMFLSDEPIKHLRGGAFFIVWQIFVGVIIKLIF